MSSAPRIRRLEPTDAAAVVACFRGVYGDSYGNGLFYDEARLAEAMSRGQLRCVGADAGGRLLGHMAMTAAPGASVPELGNTVVDPAARGGGLAWQVGAALKDWCLELGYPGFLHYPTTDHHIMQRQSVRTGFETGLMLGYIPAETDGQVRGMSSARRQAATIVYEPLARAEAREACRPAYAADLLDEFARATGLERHWRNGAAAPLERSRVSLQRDERRGLQRLTVTAVGDDLAAHIAALDSGAEPCRQIDLSLADKAIDAAVPVALDAGYKFCGWLPGYLGADAFRLQRVEASVTELAPALENDTARRLLARFSPASAP